MERTRRCPVCSGKGIASGKKTISLSGHGVCIKCNGYGKVTQAVIDDIMNEMKKYL